MKKILITLAMAILSCCSYAQYLPLTAGSGNPLTGDLHIDGTNGNRVIFSYGGVSNNKVLLGSSYSIFGTGSKDDFATYIKDSHPYSIWTNDLQRLTVDGSGNVGIGTTSPSYKLESDETDAGTNNIAYPLSVNHLTTSTATDGFGSGINFGTQNYTGTHIGAGRINVYHYTTNTTKMTFSTIYGFDNFVDAMTLFNGNVGVGTASPSAKLDIVGGAVSVTNPNPTCVFVDNANSNYSWSIQNTAGAYRFYDNTADAERLRISSNGNIGIGTTSPGSKLDVNGSINMVNGGNLTWGGIYGTGIPTIGANSTAGLVFYPGGSTSGESLRINPSGNVGIGTVDPKGYRLAVAGDAIAESMTVDLQANWPDYVFKKNFQLAPLSEVKAYIDKNEHLPGVPTAEQVSKTGINLGEMNALLLKKVEELTLYLIEKDKQDKEKEARLQSQQHQIDELKRQITNIIAAEHQ